jgi:hypothetical protein
MNNSKNNQSKKVREMSRKQFFKTPGRWSITAACVLAFLGALVTSASAQDDPTPVGFRFVANSRTATVNGVRYLAQLNGEGLITGTQVAATGSYNIVIDTSPVPKTIVSSGTWRGGRLTGFALDGTYGALAAGHLEMNIDLVPSQGTVMPATLDVRCNLAAAGLTSEPYEGYVLSIPGTAFGPFMPFVPVLGGPPSGLTVFNVLVNQQH